MSEEQVSRVYAAAVFAAASEAGSVERSRADLRAFATALSESKALADVVFNPQVDPEAKRRVVGELTHDADRLAAATLSVLLEKGRIELLSEVVTEYDRLAAEADRVVDLELTTAVEAAPAVEQSIVVRVEKATGLQARVTRTVDPGILGGLVLRVGDRIVDGSLRARLQQLRTTLHVVEVKGGDS